LTGCTNSQSSSTLEVSSHQNSLVTNSPSPNPENTINSDSNADTPEPSDTNSVTDPEQQFYSESTEIALTCGENYNFENFEINSQCPLDEDKDGRPDTDIVTFSFVNKSPQHSYLTFEGTVNEFFRESILDPKFQNLTYIYSSASPLFYSTAKLNPNQVIKIDRLLNSANNKFIFRLGVGKVQISSSESKIISLKCPEFGIDSDRVYGVRYNLSCSGNRAKLTFDNDATQARGVMVEHVQKGVSWIYSQPYYQPRAFGGLSLLLLRQSPKGAENYQAQIFYP
jgi:hypothetical protein